MPDLEISPNTVSLTARQAQQFQAFRGGTPERNVLWSVEKGDGKIDETAGVYRSPRLVFRSRQVSITATPATGGAAPAPVAGGAPATATVELSSISFWTHFLGWYWFVWFAALALIVLLGWKKLCPTCEVLVNPPVVTLTASQTQSFTANTDVTWSPTEAANGLYRAPAEFGAVQRVTITAAAKGDPEDTGKAEVFLARDFGFSLHPPSSTLAAGSVLELTAVFTRGAAAATAFQAPRVEWLKPAVGDVTPKGPGGRIGVFRAPRKGGIAEPTTVLVLARTVEPGTAVPRIAGAHVTILPGSTASGACAGDCASRTATGLLALIAVLGALGGLIHGISSFTTYVGNRELLPSWIWSYVFKPVVGALVAVAVYLAFRAGLGPGDYALSSADCLTTAAFAVLIGLFAESATGKLKEIFETLFTLRRDLKQDAAGEVKPTTPKLERLEPETLTVKQDPLPTLRVIGSGFVTGSKVKLGTEPRETAFRSASELHVTLLAADVDTEKELQVTVYNKPPDDLPSNPKSLPVKKP